MHAKHHPPARLDLPPVRTAAESSDAMARVVEAMAIVRVPRLAVFGIEGGDWKLQGGHLVARYWLTVDATIGDQTMEAEAPRSR